MLTASNCREVRSTSRNRAYSTSPRRMGCGDGPRDLIREVNGRGTAVVFSAHQSGTYLSGKREYRRARLALARSCYQLAAKEVSCQMLGS